MWAGSARPQLHQCPQWHCMGKGAVSGASVPVSSRRPTQPGPSFVTVLTSPNSLPSPTTPKPFAGSLHLPSLVCACSGLVAQAQRLVTLMKNDTVSVGAWSWGSWNSEWMQEIQGDGEEGEGALMSDFFPHSQRISFPMPQPLPGSAGGWCRTKA